MTTHSEIEDAEAHVTDLKNRYLRRWGWENTCNMPGSYWLWRRDFGDVDARRAAFHAAHPKTSRPHPMGMITAPTDLAIGMTTRELDDQPKLETTESD